MRQTKLKRIIAAGAVVILMCGCASRSVRCDGQLQPINIPQVGTETTAEPDEVEIEVPAESEAARDD